MFRKARGKTKFMYFPWAASSGAIAKGAAVAFSSGYIIKAANDVAVYKVVGVIRHAIATTDSDYATTHNVEVEVPVENNVEWEGDMNGTLLTTSVGDYFDFYTDDSGLYVDVAVSTLDHVLCTKYISASKGLFVLNCGALACTHA